MVEDEIIFSKGWGPVSYTDGKFNFKILSNSLEKQNQL